MSSERRGDSRRTQLLDAAALVIAERGFCATRLADVADRAGLSAPLAVYYFGTREQLLVEALRHTEDRFYELVRTRLATADTSGERLRELLAVCCSPEPVVGLPQGWALWFELWSQAARNPTAARDRTALDERWRATVAEVVEAGQQSGEFAADLDAQVVTHMLTALMDGLAVQIALDDHTVTPSVAARVLTEFCARVLGVDLVIDESTSQA